MKKPGVLMIMMGFVFGSFALGNFIGSPRFGAIRWVDLLQLVGAGMWYGIALTAFFAWLFARRKALSKD
jgi:hypothetical protein